MTTSMKWHIIKHGQDNIPDLFLAAVFDDDGYKLYLTDLTRVWSQAKDKREIIESAESPDCPIKPREDQAQYSILIDKLRAATKQQAGTSLEISSWFDRCDPSHHSMVLDISLILHASLPHPLPELTWPCALVPIEEDTARSIILQPLLATIYKQRKQINDLVEQLGHKDHVIRRILDVFDDNSGMDLNEVFRSHGNRTMSRKTLEKHVTGLAPFDKEEWSKIWETHHFDQKQSQQFADVPAKALDIPRLNNYQDEEWFRSVKLDTAVADSAKSDTDVEEQPQQADNTLAQQQVRVTDQQLIDTTSRKRKLGAIGGRKEDIVTKPASAQVVSTTDNPKAKLDTIGERKTATIAQENNRISEDAGVAKSVSVESVTRPKVKIGVIGGKKIAAKKEETENDLTTSDVPRSLSKESEETRPRTKLGVIGGKKTVSKNKESDSVETGVSEEPDETRTKASLDSLGSTKVAAEAAECETASESSTRSPPRQKRKIGAIGGSNTRRETALESSARSTPLDDQRIDATNGSDTKHDTAAIKQEPAGEEHQDRMALDSKPADSTMKSKEERPSRRKPLVPAGRKRMF